MAPELVEGGAHDHKVDVWAMGCVLYNLCALRPPFTGDSLASVSAAIAKRTPDHIPAHYSSALSALIMRMLTKGPRTRPSMAQV